MEQWIYKGPSNNYESKIIDDSELEQYTKEGWRVSFRENGEGESPLPLPADTPVELELSEREKAEAMGIKVDGRWSDKRIREEIVNKRLKDDNEGLAVSS